MHTTPKTDMRAHMARYGISLVNKRHSLRMWLRHLLLTILTLGRYNYMRTWSSVGKTIYYPDSCGDLGVAFWQIGDTVLFDDRRHLAHHIEHVHQHMRNRFSNLLWFVHTPTRAAHEKEAFLQDVLFYRMPAEKAAKRLWSWRFLWCAPPELTLPWFADKRRSWYLDRLHKIKK